MFYVRHEECLTPLLGWLGPRWLTVMVVLVMGREGGMKRARSALRGGDESDPEKKAHFLAHLCLAACNSRFLETSLGGN